MEIKSLLKNIRFILVKNGCGHSGLRTLKLPVFQEGINGRLIFGVLMKIQERQKLL